jgi:hypothetical protein
MYKLKMLPKIILKILVVLSALALAIILIQMTWGVNATVSQTLDMLTETPETGFILEIPQKALWRNYVHVSAEAAPGTTCELLYIPPSGATQELSSVADENGKCTWRWKIEETDGKGNGRLIITIDGASETHFIEIRRSF